MGFRVGTHVRFIRLELFWRKRGLSRRTIRSENGEQNGEHICDACKLQVFAKDIVN